MKFGDDVLHKILDETIAGDFDMLLGRRTYEIFADYWPKHDDNPIGKSFNKAKKYIATRTLKQLDWRNSQRIGEDIANEIHKLKSANGSEIHIWGSSNLLQTLIAADLVDEYQMWICPVVLGKGKRLFENNVPPRTLNLIDTITTSTGVLINTYRPAGAL